MGDGSMQALVQEVQRYNAELILNAEGLLELRQGQHVPLALRQQIGRRRFEIVELLCRDAGYRLTNDRLARLRRWTESAVLDALSDALWSWPGVEVHVGEAGARAAYWLRCYDESLGRTHVELQLRGLFYGAMLSWRMAAVGAAP